MAWRDELRKVEFADGRELIGAAFRDVPFFVASHERAGGRRTVRHQFPNRNQPYLEDLGLEAPSFQVEGYVLGGDYLAQRDRLIAALETAGAGTLIHPAYGERTVQVARFRVRESTRDGGVAVFGIEFDQTEVQPSTPEPVPSAPAEAAAEADAMEAAQAEAFISTPAPRSQTVLDDLGSAIADASLAMRAALAPIVQDVQQAAALEHQSGRLVEEAVALAEQPAALLAAIGGVIGWSGKAVLDAKLAVRALLQAYGFAPSRAAPLPGSSGRTSWDLLFATIRVALVAQAARLALEVVPESYEEAIALRDSVTSALDALSEQVGDATYLEIQSLRATLTRAIPAAGRDLPHLVTITPEISTPSLLLAYRELGSLDLEADLVARNRVERPGFVTGGRPLEVLRG